MPIWLFIGMYKHIGCLENSEASTSRATLQRWRLPKPSRMHDSARLKHRGNADTPQLSPPLVHHWFKVCKECHQTTAAGPAISCCGKAGRVRHASLLSCLHPSVCVVFYFCMPNAGLNTTDSTQQVHAWLCEDCTFPREWLWKSWPWLEGKTQVKTKPTNAICQVYTFWMLFCQWRGET